MIGPATGWWALPGDDEDGKWFRVVYWGASEHGDFAAVTNEDRELCYFGVSGLFLEYNLEHYSDVNANSPYV